MRRGQAIGHRVRWRVRLAVGGVLAAALLWRFSRYVDTEIKPTLYKLAEYEAREATAQAINTAIDTEIQRTPEQYENLYVVQGGSVTMDAAAVNTACSLLIAAVQRAIDACPAAEYAVPFGSLTDYTLLGGLGPEWTVDFQPQGYVQGRLEETTESLSVNTTRYSAVLVLQVTVNMVLDGRTDTITVTDRVPLATYLLGGEIPQVYAAGSG